MPLEVLVRLARWDEILAGPDNYSDYVPFTRAFHYAARAAKGESKRPTRLQARQVRLELR